MSETAEMIKDSSEQTFMEDVIAASSELPVIVDFWAPWCGPCRSLMPVLEKVVTAAEGKVRMVKINIDENPAIAQQLRVQSVPTVYAFKDGQPVDGFMGAQPESELKKFIDRLTGDADVEKEADELFARAQSALESGDIGGAAQDLAGAISIYPAHGPARAALARLYMEGGQADQAQAILDDTPEAAANDKDIQAMRTALGLRGDDAPSTEAEDEAVPAEDEELINALAAIEANPDDLDARLIAGKRFAAAGNNEAAIDHLLYSVAKNRAHDDEAARLFLLKVFEAEGSDSDLAKSGRARLSSILFA